MRQLWTKLLATLEGKYVLSYDLVLTQIQLATVANYYHLDVPPLIGASLAPIYDLYFGVPLLKDTYLDKPDEDMLSRFLKDATPVLPALPSETTLDRVRGMLHILNAIAQDSYEVGGGQAEDDTDQSQGKEE